MFKHLKVYIEQLAEYKICFRLILVYVRLSNGKTSPSGSIGIGYRGLEFPTGARKRKKSTPFFG